MLRTIFTGVVMIFGLMVINAQDPVFSQYYAAPLQTNAAFTGQTFGPYINMNYRNEYTTHDALVPAYVTYNLGYSQYVDKLNIGLGLMLQADSDGGGLYKNNIARAYFSYVLKMRNNYNIRWGVEAGVIQNNLDWDQLLFLDEIHPIYGPDGSQITNEIRPAETSKTLLDVGSGVLFYNKNFYVGFSAKHINTPKEQLLLINDNLILGLPVRYSLQAGMQINITKGNKALKTSFISPHLLIVKQGVATQYDVGAHLKFKTIIGGLSYRHSGNNADALIPFVGYEKGVFKFGYSFDFSLSALRSSGGTQEISVIINLDNSAYYKRKKYENKYTDCFGLFR